MSFTAESRDRSRPVLPLAPMVDVMFLLLIFFMTSSVFREQERQIDVTLPDANVSDPGAGKAPIIITVDAEGNIFIGEGRYNLQTLRQTLKQLAEQFPNESVLIRGDRSSQLGLIIQVLDIARSAGVHDVGLATTKPASDL